MNFENLKNILPRDLSKADISKILEVYLENEVHERLPRLLLLRHFSTFMGFRAISREILKVTQIYFGKSEKILPRELSKVVIFKFLDLYLENLLLEIMPRFVVLGAFLAIFQRSSGKTSKLKEKKISFF